MINHNKLLSVCISSYNKGLKSVVQISKLIDLNDDRLVVVVCDNCSDYKTWDLLRGIHNDQVVLHRNTRNIGACPNWFETINRGEAKYCLHILDRDYFDVAMITALLDFLEKEEVGAGYLGNLFYNEQRKKVTGEIEVYKGGEDSASRLGGFPFHPSGFFVNRDEWIKGDFKKYFYNEQKYGIYPHSYVLCKVAQRSDVAIMSGAFCKCVFSNREISNFYNGSKKDFWWEPTAVFDTSRKMVSELAAFFNDGEFKNQFVLNYFKHSLVRATIRCRQESMDVGQMSHYGMEAHIIPIQKLLLYNFWYTIKFYFYQSNMSIGRPSNLRDILIVSNQNRKALRKLAGNSKASYMDLEDDYKKSLEFYSVMYKWLKMKNNGLSVTPFFEKNRFKSVAIYGMKELGELLYDELQDSGCVRVTCCIDREMEGFYKGTPIRKPNEKCEVDVIVVTAIHYYSEIETDLLRRMNCKVVSIEDVIYG